MKDCDKLFYAHVASFRRDRATTWARNWRAANKEKVLASQIKTLNKNRAAVYARNALWRARNPDHHRALARRWYAENKERAKLNKQAYHARKPEVQYANKSRRRAIESNAESIGANIAMIKQIFLTAKRVGKCLGMSFHVDHIMPISRGGLHHENNLQVIPALINLRKHAKIELSAT
jgi:hypothetical protein